MRILYDRQYFPQANFKLELEDGLDSFAPHGLTNFGFDTGI